MRLAAMLASALLALPASAQQDEPPPQTEEAPAPVLRPERAPPLEPAYPITGQPDPVTVLQQDRAPTEPLAGLRQDRPVMLQLGSSLAWDSNLLRLAEARSERVSTAFVGLRIDKPYAQQRLYLDLTETAYRYENFSYLDFNALNYRGGWDWHFTPRVSGALSAERSQSLANYGDFRNATQRNLRTAERQLLAVDAWWFGGWHLLAGARREEAKYSVPFPQEGSYRGRGAEAGVRYVWRAGTQVSLKRLSLQADYFDRVLDPAALLDDGFKRSETELAATWSPTGKSTLDARLARVDYRSSHFALRDFSGNAAKLGYRWSATGNLTLDFALGRDLEPWSDVSASYRVEERRSLTAAWQFAARTTLRASVGRTEIDYRNPVPAFFAGTPRSDTVRSAQLALEWRALRNALLSAGVQRYRQSSTDPAARFEGTIASLSASLAF